MLEDDKKVAAAALRENLKNGRNRSPGESSGTPEGEYGDHVATSGATLQTPGGASRGFTPTGGNLEADTRQPGGNGRGTERGFKPIRREQRRSSEGNSGASHDSTASESRGTIGRLETFEDVLRPDEPESTFEARQADREIPPSKTFFKEEYKRTSRNGQKVYISPTGDTLASDDWKKLASQKELARAAKQAVNPKPERQFFPGQTLSKREAEELYEPLREAIASEFHVLDEALWLRCPQVDGRDIWGNVDDDETEALAKLLLKQGQKRPAAAAVVRGMIDASDYIVVGAMFVPRIQATVQALRETPKRGKPAVKLHLFRRPG